MIESDPLLEMYIFESTQMIEQTEAVILDCEAASVFTPQAINEIFRNMHTIKGSSAMMQLMNIADLAHAVEDLFHVIRENPPEHIDYHSLSDLVLRSVDFFKNEIDKVARGITPDEDPSPLVTQIKHFLTEMKKPNPSLSDEQQEQSVTNEYEDKLYTYHAIIYYYENCEMENVRAFQLVHQLTDVTTRMVHEPKALIEDEQSIEHIRDRGFHLILESSLEYGQMHELLSKTTFMQSLELHQLDCWPEELPDAAEQDDTVIDHDAEASIEAAISADSKKNTIENSEATKALEANKSSRSSAATVNLQAQQEQQPKQPKQPKQLDKSQQSAVISGALNSKPSTSSAMVSVAVEKLDRLMDLVGELVIAEAMVTSTERKESTDGSQEYHAASHLKKITTELQDTVMSIRMIPLTATFHKMRRVARDMSRKLSKEIDFILIGEDTEMDKTVIDQISDPLMHLVRNAIDHGIEAGEEREKLGKPKAGSVTLEAKNVGSDVHVIVKDDGKGLNKQKILDKAIKNGLVDPDQTEMSDRDIYNLIFKPGLSTQEQITEFSGRGVGMDVVASNIEQMGGVISVDSTEGVGMTVTMKIPLTLAIIDGMNVRVGNTHYTLPTTTIKESFRPMERDLLSDPDGNHMVMVRGECYSILSMHERFHNKKVELIDYTKGILVMVEQDGKSLCLFVDELIGQQQVVIKPLPAYLKKLHTNISGLSGCTLLGDGSISLILNMVELIGASHKGGFQHA